TLFGAEAAGIANPVNPLLEPNQIREILEAARTKVLVALGPAPGTNIWQKVEQVRSSLKHLKAIVQVDGPGAMRPAALPRWRLSHYSPDDAFRWRLPHRLIVRRMA